jgi:Tol biopolymer transport system component
MKRLLLFAFGLAAILMAFLAGTRFGERQVAFASAPTGSGVAFAAERRCAGGPCQMLWVGRTQRDAVKVATLDESSGTCSEIVWTSDGKRVAFLIDGYQLRFYNAETLSPAGQINLLEPQGHPSARIARGVTFSENGRAVTFDDCPRNRSGCRSGLAAVPQ